MVKNSRGGSSWGRDIPPKCLHRRFEILYLVMVKKFNPRAAKFPSRVKYLNKTPGTKDEKNILN